MNRREDPSTTISIMEKGQLALQDSIQYGVLLLGNTRAGKTTLAHHLAGSILMASGPTENRNFELHQHTTINREAIIGHTFDSQTQIPYKFHLHREVFKMPDGHRIVLVDCPGYSDTYGFNRIISNGFFHFLTYSKVMHIKFVLVAAYTDFQIGSNKNLTSMFVEFMSSFQPLSPSEKEKIFEATSLFVTKVPPSVDHTIMRSQFQQVPLSGTVSQDHSSAFLLLKEKILNNNRLFIFEQATEGNNNPENGALADIHSRSSFWSRDVDPATEQPSLSLIRTSIHSILLQGAEGRAEFREHFQEFGDQITKLFKNNFESLRLCLSAYAKVILPSLSHTPPSTYTEVIQQFNENILQHRGETPLDSQVRESLFSRISQALDMEALPMALKKVIWAQKINDFVAKYGENSADLREVTTMQAFFGELIDILTLMANIHTIQDPRRVEIKKFAFRIFLMLETCIVLFKIMSSTNSQVQIAQGHPLNQILVLPFKLAEIAQDIIKDDTCSIMESMFSNLPTREQDDQRSRQLIAEYLFNHAEAHPSSQAVKALFDIICEDIEKSLSNSDRARIRKMLPRLSQLLQKEGRKFNESKASYFSRQRELLSLIKSIELMGSGLMLLGKEEAAASIWENTMDGYRIMAALEQAEKRQTQPNQRYNFLMLYSRTARKFHRFEIAMNKAQEALHIAYMLKDLHKAFDVREEMNTIHQRPGLSSFSSERGNLTEWMVTGKYSFEVSLIVKKAIDEIEQNR